MLRPKASVSHVGRHIKENVVPRDLSVKKAAELVGVGRPTLSNLLNGNAALTPEMALRLEKTFGANAQELLALQADYDEYQNHEHAKEIAVRTYVGRFLAIEARQISGWADQVRARAELPALLRRLVNSTGTNLTKVDFPAFDNAQRHGWDGFVSSDAATPWIPRGDSGWEFGCDQNSARKAEEDYTARTTTENLTSEERKNITFIFVTPRNWPGKDRWAETKRIAGIWKDVRAYDASTLEQWLEQSVTTQGWFGELIGSGAEGVATLDDCWRDWADSCEPRLIKELFKASITNTKRKFETWLSQGPGSVFVVAADSISEGLAFVACALQEIGKSPGEYYDRALLLKTKEALKRTTAAIPDFVAIVASPEVELTSAGVQNTHHLLVVRLRNSIAGDADITLDLVDDQTYREALSTMGLPIEDYHHWALATGNSPTILRRRLSKVPAIKQPPWSANVEQVRKLIPLVLVGVWSSDTSADKGILSALANTEYEEVERMVAELRTIPETPVWSIGKFRGVTSKIDALFATGDLVTRKQLDDFFLVAEIVLSEDDPALDLPRADRWRANIKGKTREHSSALRKGLCETLVLLAVHGNHLFGERLGIDVEHQVDTLIRHLLLPLDGRTWSSHKGDLPRYAEASPEAFLDILEKDLALPDPRIYSLLQPAGTMPFGGGCDRSGLLWALETLAWRPDRLPRVLNVLAQLAAVQIDDNWVNKPEGSIASIFRSWMPQTAATIDERNTAMEMLCRRYSDVGWRVCMQQFGPSNGIGHYSARPHWRNDASGAGHTARTWGEIYAVKDKARELAIGWPQHNEKTLGDLIKRLQDMTSEDQERVWGLIEKWTDSNSDDTAAHILRERIRTTAFTRRARIRGVSDPIREHAREAYNRMAPKNVVMRNLWLFAAQWVEESSEELEDEKFDFRQHGARVDALRKTALAEIWLAERYVGVIRLIELAGAEFAIGIALADGVIPLNNHLEFLGQLMSECAPLPDVKVQAVVMGFISRLTVDARNEMLSRLLQGFVAEGAVDKATLMLRSAPFRAETWAFLEGLPQNWRDQYWETVNVRWEDQDESETNFLVDHLIAAKRPRAAFNAVHMDFNKLESRRLAHLLKTVATTHSERAGAYKLSSHELSDAFESLRARPDISRSELAHLEFLFADALDHSDYGIPTLEEEIGNDPQLFSQLLMLAFCRKDKGEDPQEWRIGDENAHRAMASAAYTILSKAQRLPGTDDQGIVHPEALIRWIRGVREFAETHSRGEVADSLIGQLLGRCPPGKDGVWPSAPVRQALDAIGSDNMANGFHTGRYNMRGVHMRGEGGSDERAMASQYRNWAKAVAFEYPFTAKALEALARTYEHEAQMHDTDASIRRRLEH
jgi:addiction module HigA family antidote